MAKKSLGYTELEWTCPFCDTRNPGTVEKCTSCHAPQPTDVQFEQAAEDKLITDEEKIALAKAGPDMHCPFCGARNPAGATQCSECLADLTEAEKRKSGKTIGAHRDKAAPDVACPSCGQMNAASAMKCEHCGASLAETRQAGLKPPTPQKKSSSSTMAYAIIGVIAVAVIACFGIFAYLSSRTEDVSGEVTGVQWERTVNIEGLVPVERETWRDEVPSGALLGSCRQEVHHTQSEPVPGATEICGTPYTVDTGTGIGEVVQDCEYQVYADYCSYTVNEWQVIDTFRREGDDYNPIWPDLQLPNDQREGSRDTDYIIIFRTDGETYIYKTDSEAVFNAAQPGTTWVLKINTFGDINDIEQE
jgi:ribosomal protein L40E